MGHLFDLESLNPTLPNRPLPRPAAPKRSEGGPSRIRCLGLAPGLSSHSKSKIQNPKSKILSKTPIVPLAIAIAVWEEASVWLDAPLPRSWITTLAERAEAIYAHNARFRSVINRRGNAGRDWLWSFTRHWLAGLLIKHRPALAARLPSAYKIGRPLHPS